MVRVVAIYTASTMIRPISELFQEHLPDIQLNNICDDSLLQEINLKNEITPAVRKRLFHYYHSAVDAGADIIFNTCASVGEVADAGRMFVQIPIIKMNDAMAEIAVKNTNRIVGDCHTVKFISAS